VIKTKNEIGSTVNRRIVDEGGRTTRRARGGCKVVGEERTGRQG
jgi:hypothetical protein